MRLPSALGFSLLIAILASTNTHSALPNYDSQGEPVPSLAPMLKQVNPAVVNISTFSTRQANINPLLNDPFFRRFFNIPNQRGYRQQVPTKRQQSAGSGVIVDADEGVVITNYHVIKGSDEVQVSLIDGRSVEAEITGIDPDLDIAILKIDADDIPEVPLADSSNLEVGDFVVAIGNPFGLGQTVTTGIVSALGRTGLGIEGYEDFIQTDASINPGNSGGALVNLRGELVGINTAIIAPSGGNVGIGFAIPINMADASMEQILKSGEVRRGQLGVEIQNITSDLRDEFDLENGLLGVLVTTVEENSPAKSAGIIPGDIILSIDDEPTQSGGQFRSRVASKEVGDTVTVKILRDGKARDVDAKIGESHAMVAANSELHNLLVGAHFENNPNGNGVVVSAISQNTAAAYNGLRPGDIILGTNRRRVNDLASFKHALSLNNSSALLQISRNGGSFFLVLR